MAHIGQRAGQRFWFCCPPSQIGTASRQAARARLISTAAPSKRNSLGARRDARHATHTTPMDQLYLRCEDRLAAWGESLRSCCDAFERTCCGALIARKKTRAALICGSGRPARRQFCVAPAVRRNLEKWARKHGVDELHTAPTWASISRICDDSRSARAVRTTGTRQLARLGRVGKENWRGAWLMFCAHSHAVVFVVDATDVDRLGLARKRTSPII